MDTSIPCRDDAEKAGLSIIDTAGKRIGPVGFCIMFDEDTRVIFDPSARMTVAREQESNESREDERAMQVSC